MPVIRRRRFMRKRPTNKRRYIRKRPTVRSLARRVSRLVRQPEKKYCEINTPFFANFALTNGAGLGHNILSAISIIQGTGIKERVGNTITSTSFQYSFDVYRQATTTQRLNYHIYILQAIQQADSVLTVGQGGTLVNTFLNPDNSGTQYSPKSLRNLEYFNDWRVLRRIRGVMPEFGGTAAGSVVINHNGYIRWRSSIRFDGAYSTPTRNNVYVLFIVDGGDTVAATGLYSRGMFRICYTDA